MSSNIEEPVSTEDRGEQLEDGIGIALSGGGYRATLFHLGGLLRLFEAGLLMKAARISSVSGGSITSAKVALEWPRLTDRDAFMTHVVAPIRKLTAITIDIPSIVGGLLLPGSVADRVAEQYRRHLFGDATLQDLPDAPRFVINATNVETGSLWRFSKPYMRDWRVGTVERPTVPLAEAVTASSAFPPVLSPYVLRVGADDFTQIEPGVDERLLEDVSLTDGGVYDNLGLETVYKRYRTLLVADAGGALQPDPSPPADWAQHAKRVLDIIHGQVSSVRVRQLIQAFDRGDRKGAYWGIRSDIANLGATSPLPAPLERTRQLAATPTRLKRLSSELQERLINWGYAACDAAVRGHVLSGGTPAAAFPYPSSGV
ncbi:NTE family protein [Sphingobium sp. OAS761]|uniref:patatin-like phospholipase family protein n=1 Tax=Sphingobium sp. OAS761 TaxID=2817901 RepID=UPI00209CBF8B|nr:patatin-like phospholipase family protein [Sphingobium sp. OAS761]MCP1469033.1 NTE family protein [Sphingobium sp. OAS761]